jgi:hypothetical protein
LWSAEKVFANYDPNSEEAENLQGLLTYTPPSPGSGDGVVEETKVGSIGGWAFFSKAALREISSLLTLQPKPKIYIRLSVKAESEPSPGKLTYSAQTTWPYGTLYAWDGKGRLDIVEATVVANEAATAPKEEPTEEEPMQHVEHLLGSIMRGIDTLRATLIQVGIALIVMLLILLFARH